MREMEQDSGSELFSGPIGLRDAVDRWGPDLSKWPDVPLLRHGREALLADRSFRAYRDGAAAIEHQLKAASSALDQRLADGGALDRITRKVLARAAPRPVHWYRRIAAAAAVMVVAGLLGGVSEWARINRGEMATMTVVQLDPMLFGPAEAGF